MHSPLACIRIAIFVVCAGFSCGLMAKESAITDLETILSEPLDDSEYIVTERCLSSHEYTNVDILDSGHLLFYGRRGKIWLNELRSTCTGLRKGLVLQFDMRDRRLCNRNYFSGINSFSSSGHVTARCVLGLFELVTEEQVMLLEESLAKEKTSDVLHSRKSKN
ncbi:MAG: hypothetical protein KUG75_11365 [Pseudomonadales bacterium]|nr:hypothetical protein [Pseudomonadales bacterium]